jgi:glycyl-tRNA synthetase
MFDAYSNNEKGEIILKLNPKLSPVKTAIFPLVKKDEKQVEIAKKIYHELQQDYKVDYDESGSVGKRYARNDEIGTPFCITVYTESENDKKVTIRNRDTTEQKRIAIKDVKETVRKLISGEIKFENLS